MPNKVTPTSQRASPTPLFRLGQLLITPGALALVDASTDSVASLLQRHVTGDYGDLCAEDIASNQQAVRCGARILSNYRLQPRQSSLATRLVDDQSPTNSPLTRAAGATGASGEPDSEVDVVSTTEPHTTTAPRVWIITEADRACTTLLLPSEY
jgi:hypothetical protein